MLTIKEIAEHANKTARMHGKYGDDPERAIVEKLLEEIDELETAIYGQNYGHYPMDSKDNDKFKASFEEHTKDTVGAELADIIITALAGAVELGIPIELNIERGLRYNRLRKYDEENN